MKKIQYIEKSIHNNSNLLSNEQDKCNIVSIGVFLKNIKNKFITKNNIELHYNLCSMGHIQSMGFDIDGDIFIKKELNKYKFNIDYRKVNYNLNEKTYHSFIFTTNNLDRLIYELKPHLSILAIED